MSRAAEVRRFTRSHLPDADPRLLTAYSKVAARWEQVREAARTAPTPGVDAELAKLTTALRQLVDRLLPADAYVRGRRRGDRGVDGITDNDGFLFGDPERLLNGEHE